MFYFNNIKSLLEGDNKLLGIVKMTIYFSFLGLLLQGMLLNFLIAVPTSGQDLKDVKITMNVSNVTFEQALQLIEAKTDFKFFYLENEVPLKEQITVDVTNESLYNLLKDFAEQYGLVFQRINNQILIKKASAPESESSLVMQENVTVKGRVIDATTREPLPAANIVAVSLTVGAATDKDGNYSFMLPTSVQQGQTVQIKASYVGYKSQTKDIVISSNTIEVNFELQTDVFSSEQIVVTGVASKREKSVSEVSVARIDAEELSSKQVYSSFDQLLAGKVSGVEITKSNGNLGGSYRFFMRGGGGLNGNGQPLIFIDGVRADNSQIFLFGYNDQPVSNMSSLDPDNIANIEVLKGPAAAAMYGTDASNGVVLITTKSGQLQPGGSGFSINYKLEYGSGEPAFKYDPNLYFGANVMNDVLRTGLMKTNYINVSGGNSLLRYYASFNSSNNEGIHPLNNENLNEGQLNLTAFPSKNLTIKLNANYSQDNLNKPESDDQTLGLNWEILMFPKPWRVYSSLSNPTNDSVSILSIKDNIWKNRFIGGTQVTWTPISNLEIFGSFGVDATTYREQEILPPSTHNWTNGSGDVTIATFEPTNYSYQVNATYNYSPLDGLNISSVVGAQLYERWTKNLFLERENFSTSLIQNIQAGSLIIDATQGALNTRQAGIYTSHTISYQDKYFATLGLREDFASAIGQDAPSILYPQASFAIRLDRLGVLPEAFNLFKLRAAYGESGQLPGVTDGQLRLYTAGGTAYGTGALITSVGNPSIKPERVKEFEFGLDAEFLNNYSIEITHYNTYVSNSILGIPNSPSSGLSYWSTPSNIGTVKGQGIELLLQAEPVRTPDFDLNMKFIWNWQKNEVTNLGPLNQISAPYAVNYDIVGYPLNEFYAYYNPGAKFNADGTYAGPQDAIRGDLGSPIPNHTGSFSLNITLFKNLSLYAMANWALNVKVFSILRDFAAGRGGYKPYYVMAYQLGDQARISQLESWGVHLNVQPLTPGTPEYISVANEYARMNPSNRGNFIVPADYFALREVSISYDFTDLLRNSNIISDYVKGLSVGFSATNLFRVSKYEDGDFEVNGGAVFNNTWNVDYGTLPQIRSYTFFLRVSI